MSSLFYISQEYKNKQSLITRKNWKLGVYKHDIKPYEIRHCKNKDCDNTFRVKPGNPKVFCSSKCSAHFNNMNRKLSDVTKLKIAKSLSLLPKREFKRRKEMIIVLCKKCNKSFSVFPYMVKTRKYCSNECATSIIGGRTTSPKASKGKNGIRMDIDPKINFYSTWEANMARVFNLVGLKWEFSPRIFDLGKHTYRPDFYLPDFDMFIEVKNFLSPYSLERDTLFRQEYPNIKLVLILKDDYLEIKSNYKGLVENWEH